MELNWHKMLRKYAEAWRAKDIFFSIRLRVYKIYIYTYTWSGYQVLVYCNLRKERVQWYLGSARNGVWGASGPFELGRNEAVLFRGSGPGIHTRVAPYKRYSSSGKKNVNFCCCMFTLTASARVNNITCSKDNTCEKNERQMLSRR